MIDEPFASGDSVMHRLDPRCRIIAAIGYSIAVAVLYSFQALFLAAAVSLGLLISSNLGLGRVLSRMLMVNGFVLLFWLVLPISAGGEVLFQWGPLSFYKQGITVSTQITLKSNAIIMALIALTDTRCLTTMGRAKKKIKKKKKLVYLLILTYRYIFVIEAEFKKIQRAVKIRGFTPATSIHCYRTYAYIIGMLFVRASARAEQVHRAMRCRGFSGRFYTLAEFESSFSNWIFSVLMGLAIISLLILELTTL